MPVFTTKINLFNNKYYQSTGSTLDLSGTTRFKNIEYISDNTGNYNDRSLIDKGYLDFRLNTFTGSTSALVTGGTNGNTLLNKNIELGGTLNKNTDIDISNNTLRLGELSDFGGYFYVNSTLVEVSNYYDGVNNSKISMYFSGDTKSTLKLESTTSGDTAGYIINHNGLQALDNYYSGNTNNNRWIPDKEYVDSHSSSGGTVSIIDKTYIELYNMVTGSTLTKGQYYRITDFQTIYQLDNTTEILTGNTESLIVFALDINKISNNVKSQNFPNDIIEYNIFDNSCEDGTWDSSLQRSVGGTFRKGKITYRKDTNINLSTYYDWRNIKFRRWAVDAIEWTGGTLYNQYDVIKSPVDGKIYVAKFETTGITDPSSSNIWQLWLDITTITPYWSWGSLVNDFNIGDISTTNLSIDGNDYNDYYTFTLIDDLTNSSGIITGGTNGGTIGLGYKNIEIGYFDYEYYNYNYGNYNPYYNNIVIILSPNNDNEYNFISNKINSNNTLNTIIINYFKNNEIGNDFMNNCIFGDFFENTINNGFIKNIINTSFNNIIGDEFNDNIVGDNFNNNIIGNSFNTNIIGDLFYSNVIESYFNNNIIGNNFQINTIGNDFSNNTIGDYFQNNNIGDNFQNNNIIEGSFENNQIRNGFNYNDLNNLILNNNILIISGDTSINLNDFNVLINSPLNSVTITLNVAGGSHGDILKFKDVGGNANVNNIVVNGNGHNIDGQPTLTINTNYGGVEIIYNTITSTWNTLSFIN